MCRLWFLAQIDGFEYGYNGVGWIFWNMKIEQGECVFLKKHQRCRNEREFKYFVKKE
jgi:hypothetical protein